MQPLIQHIVDAIHDKKGRSVALVDLSAIEQAPASFFIICHGGSHAQVSAIADNVRDKLLEIDGIKPFNYDGYRNSQWIIIDYGNILVHVFLPENRQFYNLEDLWGDAAITNIPDLD